MQAEALSQSDELKTALLRAVSHDLRSPLMAITTAAGACAMRDLDADERELLDTITDQSARMSRMIENLLDLSQAAGRALPPPGRLARPPRTGRGVGRRAAARRPSGAAA